MGQQSNGINLVINACHFSYINVTVQRNVTPFNTNPIHGPLNNLPQNNSEGDTSSDSDDDNNPPPDIDLNVDPPPPSEPSTENENENENENEAEDEQPPEPASNIQLHRSKKRKHDKAGPSNEKSADTTEATILESSRP